MNLNPYPKYKDSRIEWLGKVPEYWELGRLKYVFWLQRGHDLPINELQIGEYPVYGSNGCIGYHDQFTTKGPGITIGRSGSVGEVNYINADYWAHNTALYVKEFRRSEPRFTYYLLKTLDVKYLSEGTAVGTLNRNNIHNLNIAIPSIAEQRLIASYIDCETAKIDALIAKKQRQIELLQEKRIALINHAVTKGLDPNVRMKDSGVEWLGEIPENWEITRLKRIAQLRSGDSITSSEIEETGAYPVYGGNGLRGYASSYTHEGERVLIGRQGALCGCINYAKDCFWASEHAVVATPIKPIAVKWLGELLRSMNLNQYSQSAAQPGLAVEAISTLLIPLPAITEQEKISAFIDHETIKINALAEKVLLSIKKLQEYRTALISAAVMGKIDVRGEKVA